MRSTLKRTRCAGGFVGNDRRGAELPFDDRGAMREGDAKCSAGDVPVLHDLSEHPVHSCAGYRETHSGAPQVHAGVDADDRTGGVHQRSSAVARVDRSVCLDHAFQGPVPLGGEGPGEACDDAEADRLRVVEWVTHRQAGNTTTTRSWRANRYSVRK